MVDSEVYGTKVIIFAEDPADFVGGCIYDFDSNEGAIDDKVARFVENDVGDDCW